MPASIVTCPNCGRKNRLRPSSEGVPRCSVCHETLPWLVDADPQSFDEEIRASVPVVVDFWAPWCGPCRAVAPMLEALAGERAGKLKIAKLNVDENPRSAARFAVQAIPTMILFRGPIEVDQIRGAVPKAALEARLARAM
jgi:thioredoxin 2